jgi:recombination protein RecA
MDFDSYINTIKKNFGKTFKAEAVNLELNTVDKELPPTGIQLDNPLLEYAFDRRFMAYGRCYLIYGKKGCSKTTLLFDLAKVFQKAGGKFFWIETENAPDFRYMELQGVDPKGVHYHNPKSLEEALTLCKIIIENYAKHSDGKTPIMIALDSIAGGSTEYEQDQDVIGQTKVGEHAKLMSAFYRNIVPHLECENIVFVATNQLKEQIGGMTGFGTEKPEALIGGEAQRFNSTYQFKVARIRDNLEEDHMGVKRKSGSTHTLVVKRNKLGREGNSQKIEFDIHINGGVDWYSPLVRMLGEHYTSLVGKTGGWYTWKTPDVQVEFELENGEKQYGVIDTEKKYREQELGFVLKNSPQAKEMIRQAFGVPDMPPPEIEQAIAETNKTKRKKKSELELEEPADRNYRNE